MTFGPIAFENDIIPTTIPLNCEALFGLDQEARGRPSYP